MPPKLEFAFEIVAKVAAPVVVGETPSGLRRIVEILEGTVDGPLLRGTILPGGADWQILRTDGVAELHAHYVLKTADGILIQVRNRGLRHGPEEVLRRIAEGHRADPSEYYFRCTPIFEAPAGPYGWLNRHVFAATAEREAAKVIIQVFLVR